MDLPAARTLIQRTCERMNVLYGQVVFDEWAILSQPGDGVRLDAYVGPRVEQFRSRFVADTHALRDILADRRLAVGEFAFAPVAAGTAYDACVRLGAVSYLLLNHTQLTMEEIRRDPRWLEAQRPFVEMTEAFHASPFA